ncbi:NLR family CARD domain-containing 3-like isoform X2 [Paramuricea clavata]|uniref:NLR family CARD domain-containing 3-like isoform X2 n=1 Tax=Paramuricea clavata TaxID=317549 RepID=A0A6S7HJX9_PARCT|nr:NLR family CARD domain-containing 3-like isoform X2 [Paramuricea clavata]
MANFHMSNRRKRGRQPSSLSVLLFLLDPDKKIIKVSRETKKEVVEKLMQEGCGPPQPGHCVSDGKVEFSLGLTNEQFKQKLVEIYPKLENAAFVFMKADKHNTLEELNHGMCCFRCYTPENVYHSERGQGKLYIKLIQESEISQCTHGVSPVKKLRVVPGHIQQRFVPIQPKLSPEVTITGIESRSLLVMTPGAMPVLDLSSARTVLSSGNIVPQRQFLSAIVPQTEPTPPWYSTVNISTQSQLSSAVISQSSSSQPVDVILQNQLPTSIIASQIESNQSLDSSVSMAPQDRLHAPPPMSSQTIQGSGDVVTQNRLPAPTAIVSQAATNAAMSPFQDRITTMTRNQIHTSTIVSGSMARQEQFSRSIGVPDTNSEPSELPNAEEILDELGWLNNDLGSNALIGATDTQDERISNDQRDLVVEELPQELFTSALWFLENVKSRKRLKISLSTLEDRDIMEKLNASTVSIRNVEIESSCKLHQALRIFSLPSCLTVLRINDNNLNSEDVLALMRSLSTGNSLHELYLSRTRFKDNTFISFLDVLISCSSLRKLCLIDNGLTKQEINLLITAFKRMKNLVNLNLSKSNLTETQANDILRKDGEGKCIVSLDLSQNALQGNEIIFGICQLQSLEELNLTGNYMGNMHKLEKQLDHLPINTKTISLSSSHMMPMDISCFCFLVKSDLLKLNLDFNHVGNSILSLFSQSFKRLQVLSLANTDIGGPAVKGLATLLSLVGELEELNLSSNNLVLADFQHLQSPLSNLTQLKRLNLSNNPDGISVILHEILPSLKYLEEFRLSNVHLNGDDLNKTCDSLASLKGLKHLDLSMNAIGPDGTRALANILKEFPLLEGLDMSKSCIKEDEISVLFRELDCLNRLKYLNLSGNRIDIEVIRDPVFLPSMLEELIFSNIIHGGKLFSIISSLQHLRKLHLSEINLRPCDVEALTFMLLLLLLLEELVLAKIVCTDCGKIFSAIKTLKNIKKIDLTGMKIPDGNAFAETLSSLLPLEELVLTNISVADNECKIIFGAIKSLKKLKILDLTGIKVPDGNAIAEMLSSLLLLEELVLAKTDVVWRNAEIFSKIKLLKNLRKLHLGSMRLWNEKGVFDMLSSFSFLEDIVFPRVNLVHADDIITFSALKSVKYLKILNLRVTCDMAEYFASVLPSLTLLEKLVLLNGNIDRESEKQVLAAVGRLTYLKELELKWDKISQAGADSLAEVLPLLQLLEKVVLGYVGCDDEGEKRLFTSIGKLSYLKELKLYFGGITQVGADRLAEVLLSLQLLEKIELFKFSDDSMGHLSGRQLFAAIGKLKYLKELELEWYGIAHADADSLAEVLPSLKLLEKLVLGSVDCDNHDETEKQLFTAVGKLTYLKELELNLYCITQAGADSLAEVLPSLQLLERLVLDQYIENIMDDLSGKQLFAAVGKLTYLKELKLQLCIITQNDADTLAEVLPSLQLLEKLVLDFVDKSGKQLFASVGKLTYLKELELKFCTITQAGADSLAEVLPSLQLLEKLVLRNADFDYIVDESRKQLFAAVGKLPYLKELELGHWCETTQTGPGRFAEVLLSLPHAQLLEKLVLHYVGSGDDIDDESGKQLFAAVGKLTYLKELDLRSCEITQAGADSLAEVLPSLQLLEMLSLREIDFRNVNDHQLFSAVGSLNYLKELHLYRSKITDAGAEILIDALPSLRNLTCIILFEICEPLRSRLIAAAGRVPGLEVI